MNKITKIALILFICLFNVLILSIFYNYPISISETTATFFQIPIYFWLALSLSPLLLFIIAKYTKNKFVSIFCAIFYYFIFYSYGLFFISHPTISDIGSSTLSQNLLNSYNHIGSPFDWPVHFSYSKIFSSILDTNPISTINLGFISLITIFPIFIILFFKEKNEENNNTSSYFIIPTLYLTLAFFFINDQFVPQFLALIYLILLFGFYIKYNKTKSRLFFVLIIIFYTLTVFTHAFMYIFFLIAIIFEKIVEGYIERGRKSVISYEMIMILLVIPFTYLAIYLEQFRRASYGESWRIIDYIYSQRTPVEGIQTQPLFNLVPFFYDEVFSTIVKVILICAFFIIAIGFILNYLKKKDILDLSIISGSVIWFILGMSKMVLGQRALQVAPLALMSNYKFPYRFISKFKIVIIIIILIAPVLFIVNTTINESLIGERLIQDTEENIAGRFLDVHIDNESWILAPNNAYPIGLYNGVEKFSLENIITNYNDSKLLDLIISSPKLKLRCLYLNLTLPINPEVSVVYNNKNIDIFNIN